jgi:predicted Rossmann fold nucleotide-binding protein DprA/Smf involved in DNA uptake
MKTLGNTDLLSLHKTAFLCSRKIPVSAVLQCYDWAIEQREKGNCVISGFHSQIEKDVLHYLLKGSQPIIIALARGFKQKLDKELTAPMEKGRLLVITPFDLDVKRVTSETAIVRNKLMLDLADKVKVAYASKGGELEKLLSETKQTKEFF